MKTPLILAAASLAAIFFAPSADATLVAYWNFNGLTASTNNGTSYSPTSGTAGLVLEGWTTTGSSGITSFGGTTVNALNSDPSGQSLSLQGGTSSGTPNNGATLTISFSMVSLTDPVLSFATQGTGTGFGSNQISYSTNGTDFTNFGSAYTPASSYAAQVFDFSSIDALDGATTAYIRITFSGASGSSGNNRIDNIQINAVPEPAAALLGSLGLIGLLRRRRA